MTPKYFAWLIGLRAKEEHDMEFPATDSAACPVGNVDDRLGELVGVPGAFGGHLDLIRINEARTGPYSLTELGEFQDSSKGKQCRQAIIFRLSGTVPAELQVSAPGHRFA